MARKSRLDLPKSPSANLPAGNGQAGSRNLLLASLMLPLALAALMRISYWIQVHDQPWFAYPGMDPEFYSRWADDILKGHAWGYIPFPRAPLYPYLIAGIRALFGADWLAPRLLNLATDLTTLILVYLTTRQVGGKKSAVIAAYLYAFCGSAIYLTGELLMSSLETCACALTVYLLVMTLRNPGAKRSASVGAALGILMLFRPNAILLLPATLTAIIYSLRGKRSQILSSIGSHLGALAIILAPVTILNYVASGELIPISTQGGVNFYIGNADGANGWSSTLPGVGSNWDDNDARQIAETDAGGQLTTSGISTRLWQMGWREIVSKPVAWGGLICRKILMLANIREAGDNRPLALAEQAAPQLRLLFLVSFGLLLIPASVGFALGLRRSEVRIITFLILLYAISILMFFVNSRYRMPMVPPLLVLSGCGIVWAVEAIGRCRAALLTGTTIFGTAVLTLPNWIGNAYDSPAQDHFVRANSLMRAGRFKESLTEYDRTAVADGHYPELHLNRGAALLKSGDTVSAEKEFRAELTLIGPNPRAWNNLGVIAEGKGELELALSLYDSALQVAPGLDDARTNASQLEVRLGDSLATAIDWKGAEERYHHAERLIPDDPDVLFRMAAAEAALGNPASATDYVRQTLRRAPHYQPALELLKHLEEHP